MRHVPLALSRSADGSGYSIVSPPRAEIAPPGYYMLFLVNDQGVPSKASWVRVG